MIPARAGARVFLRENLWHVMPPPRRESSSPFKQSAAVRALLEAQERQKAPVKGSVEALTRTQ